MTFLPDGTRGQMEGALPPSERRDLAPRTRRPPSKNPSQGLLELGGDLEDAIYLEHRRKLTGTHGN
jgi:hypothetical protein